MSTGKVIPFPFQQRISSSQVTAYTLSVYLVRGPYGEEFIDHKIYRTLKIRSDQTLEDLHHAILCAFEREVDQSYEFYFGKDPYTPTDLRYLCREESLGQDGKKNNNKSDQRDQREKRENNAGIVSFVSLDSLSLTEDQFFSYWFDLTETWLHLIHVVCMEPVKDIEDYPLLIERVGDSPQPLFSMDDCEEDLADGDLDDLLEEEMLVMLVAELQIRWRRQIENLPLRPQTELKTALNKIPAHWMEAISWQVGLDVDCPRKERIKRVSALLREKEVLQKIWRLLPLPSREMLNWILIEKNGCVKIQVLSRRYGADPDVTWWWNEGQVPESPLGLLRFNGLVYIGKTREDKRRVRIAAIPVELRKALKKIIQDSASMDDAPPLPQPAAMDSSFKLSAKEILDNARFSPSACRELWKGLDSLSLKSFLAVCPFREDTESIYIYMLGRIRRNPKAFVKRDIREFLLRVIQGSSEWSRLAAYKFGMSIFNERFAETALNDSSRMIQQWAQIVTNNPQERLF